MTDSARMNQYLYEGKAQDVVAMETAAQEAGRPVAEVLNEGLIGARVMTGGLSMLRPLLEAAEGGCKSRGTLLVGSVKGDLHDIGKTLVCMIAEGVGFEVIDMGVDHSAEEFVAAVGEHEPDLVGMSARS